MAIKSNIFEWIGDSIDMTLNSFVQITSSNIINMFTDFFIYGGTLTFVLMGFAPDKSALMDSAIQSQYTK